MQILFIQPTNIESIGLMRISSVLKKHGHYCDVLMESDPDKIVKYLKKTDFDFVGFSAMTPMHNWIMKVARRIKKETDCKTIVGGPHATFYPEIVENQCIDFICRGEGEYPMLEFANKYDAGEDLTDIKNIWTVVDGKIKKNPVRPLIEDLDELPFPDWDLYYDKYPQLRNWEIKRFISGRGCPYDCKFCHNPSLKEIYSEESKFVRKRSPRDLIDEIKRVKKRYGASKIWFGDDTFTFDKDWLNEFLDLYKRQIKIPFAFQTRADLIEKGDIKMLKKAGCHDINIGVETGNEKMRKEVLNKKISNEQIIKVANMIKKSKINLTTYNMIGLPEETMGDIFETISFNRELGPEVAWCFKLKPFPKTGIANYAVKNGYLSEDFDLEKYNKMTEKLGERVFFHPNSKREATNLSYLFQIAVKFPKSMPLIKYLIKKPVDNRLNYPWKKFWELINGYINSKYEYKIDKIAALKYFLRKERLNRNI